MEHNMSITTGMEASFDFTVSDETFGSAWDLFFGRRPEPSTHAVMIERQIPVMPREPVKGAPLVGKRYRMARRKWVRRMRRGIRNGWPIETVRQYIPAATITPGAVMDANGNVTCELTIEQATR